MTSLAMYLEDFGTSVSGGTSLAMSDETLETERLEAFDKGYRAGWDDAIKAKSDEEAQLADGLAQSLQELSFTYHEVHAQILSNLGPLFDEILGRMLPALAQETLGAHVADQLAGLARDIGKVQVEVSVAPGAGDHVSQLIGTAATSLPISVIESNEVPKGRADMRLGSKEITIDLSQVSAQILDAVRAVFNDQPMMHAHG